VLREIRVTAENVKIVAKLLGMDVKKKGIKPSTIYIVQDAPEVGAEPPKGSAKRPAS
jgi:hypothetical protein